MIKVHMLKKINVYIIYTGSMHFLKTWNTLAHHQPIKVFYIYSRSVINILDLFRYQDFVILYTKFLKSCEFESGTFTNDLEITTE